METVHNLTKEEAIQAIAEDKERLVEIEAALLKNDPEQLVRLGVALKEENENRYGQVEDTYYILNHIAIEELRRLSSMSPEDYAGFFNRVR